MPGAAASGGRSWKDWPRWPATWGVTGCGWSLTMTTSPLGPPTKGRGRFPRRVRSWRCGPSDQEPGPTAPRSPESLLAPETRERIVVVRRHVHVPRGAVETSRVHLLGTRVEAHGRVAQGTRRVLEGVEERPRHAS